MSRICRNVLAAVVAFVGLMGQADYKPDGHEWEDPSRLSFGTLPPRAAFGSFPDVESARQVLSELSPRTVSLDSETAWRFRWSRRPADRPRGFERPEFDDSAWDVVKVPCSWQTMGIRKSGKRYGTPIYVNQHYIFTPQFPANTNCAPHVTGNALPGNWTFGPEDNPVGSYRRTFEVSPEWSGDRIILRFDGVESFFYVWVNGCCLGFSKDSRAVSEFDVTDFVQVGENVLAVEVYRNSDGSYLECHDAFRLSGIHRSVYLTHVPRTHLEDVSIRVAPVRTDVLDGPWTLDVTAEVAGGADHRLAAILFGPEDDRVPTVEGGKFGTDGHARLLVDRPVLWNAESPTLYTLVVVLEVAGAVVETAGFDIGFRESRICEAVDPRDRVWLFNGKPVKLKGVNRGETDPLFGHHVPVARLGQDLGLIKRANFNFIRNSHFPQPERFYYLANRMGFYVMDEANIETHGLRFGPESLSHDPNWREAHMNRVRTMFERNKNQPCIVFWSLGNEAGPGDNFKACAEWIREHDRSRPVHYERNNEVADMGSCFYPTLELARDIAEANGTVKLNGRPVKYPFLFVEYAHNFNNNCGNLADFQRIFESQLRVIGGSVWDFADQALWMRMPNGTRVAAWGGCFGEKPEEGQGIMDGIVTTDRRPEPGYFEARHVFQPFAAELSPDRRRIFLESKYDFIDSDDVAIRYAVLTNGVALCGGVLPVVLKPHERKSVPVPTEAIAVSDDGVAETALRLSFVLRKGGLGRPSGFAVAEEQLELTQGGSADHKTALEELPQTFEDEAGVHVSAGEWRFLFSRQTGELISLKRGPCECLVSPVTLDAFRVPVGGETHLFAGAPCFGRLRMMDGLRILRPMLRRFDRKEVADGLVLETEIAYRGVRKEDIPGWGHGNRAGIADLGPLDADAPSVVARTFWTFRKGMPVGLRTEFRQEGRPTELQRVGWRFVWATPKTDVRYFACGPFDNYSDRKDGCFPARYDARSDQFGFSYGCSQDGGNREDARFVELSDPGIRFSAVDAKRFSFAVSPYSPTELLLESHPELLPPPSKTELGLYAKVRGLGSANCGPEPKREDRVNPDGIYVLDVEVTDAFGRNSARTGSSGIW